MFSYLADKPAACMYLEIRSSFSHLFLVPLLRGALTASNNEVVPCVVQVFLLLCRINCNTNL